MCAFPKRKLNVQLWDFPEIAAFWENPEKFWPEFSKNSTKFWQILRNLCQNQQKIQHFSTKILILENGSKTVQRSAWCRSLHLTGSERFPTSIHLQNLASIQPRTSPKKFESSSYWEFELNLQNFEILYLQPRTP